MSDHEFGGLSAAFIVPACSHSFCWICSGRRKEPRIQVNCGLAATNNTRPVGQGSDVFSMLAI
jgi:hypothetical protein